MQPGEALGIAAQVAVTLAGFAGIVVVFRPDSVHQWSRLDRLRLRLLLSSSMFPLGYSLLGMLLLTIEPQPQSIWRWCSGAVVVFQIPFGIVMFKGIRTFTPDEFKGASKILSYPVAVIGMVALLLQLYNVAVLSRFWPFFAAILAQLLAAMLQFVRLVLTPQDSLTPPGSV